MASPDVQPLHGSRGSQRSPRDGGPQLTSRLPVKESKTAHKHLIKSSSKKTASTARVPTEADVDVADSDISRTRKEADGSSSSSSKDLAYSVEATDENPLDHGEVSRRLQVTPDKPLEPASSVGERHESSEGNSRPTPAVEAEEPLSSRVERSSLKSGELPDLGHVQTSEDGGDGERGVTAGPDRGRLGGSGLSGRPGRVRFSDSVQSVDPRSSAVMGSSPRTGTETQATRVASVEENPRSVRVRTHRQRRPSDVSSRQPGVDNKGNSQDSAPFVGDMLDVRLKALDYMMNKAFPEEMLMAKMELQPRRFQRNEQLQSRWLEAQQVLVMQETLVYLTAAREKRRKNRAKQEAKERLKQAVHPGPSPPKDARPTPEGQSSDGLSETTLTSPDEDMRKPQQATYTAAKKSKAEPERKAPAAASMKKLLAAPPSLTPAPAKAPATLLEEVGKESPRPTDTAQHTRTAGTDTEAETAASLEELNVGPPPPTPPLPRNENVLQSHSESCMDARACSRPEVREEWGQSLLAVSKQRRRTKRLAYLRVMAPKVVDTMTWRDRTAHPSAQGGPSESWGQTQARAADSVRARLLRTTLPRRPSSGAVEETRKKEDACERPSRHHGHAVHRKAMSPTTDRPATPPEEPPSLPDVWVTRKVRRRRQPSDSGMSPLMRRRLHEMSGEYRSLWIRDTRKRLRVDMKQLREEMRTLKVADKRKSVN